MRKAVLFAFVMLAILAAGQARALEFLAILQPGDQITVVDSITLKRAGRNPASFYTPGFLGDPGAPEDTANLGTQAWPGEYIRVSYLYGFTRQTPVTFSAPVQDNWYELPGTATPGTIKFLLADAVAEPSLPQSLLPTLAVSPNPCSRRAEIRLNLKRRADVTLTIADVSGSVVHRIEQGGLPAGEHAWTWDRQADRGGDVPAGLYVISLAGGGSRVQKKLLVTQ